MECSARLYCILLSFKALQVYNLYRINSPVFIHLSYVQMEVLGHSELPGLSFGGFVHAESLQE